VRELRVSRFEATVVVDVLEDGRKVGETFIGPTADEQPPIFRFYDLQALTEWVEKFPGLLASLNGGSDGA